MITRKITFLALVCMGATSSVSANDTADLIRYAVRTGAASGELTGVAAERSREALNSSGRLKLDIKRLYEFAQPDCARLRLTFTQEKALVPGEDLPRDYETVADISICADGNPPQSQKRK